MPKLWMLNHYAQEPDRPGGTRHYALAKGLKTLGWDASILAASVEHNTNRQRLSPQEAKRLEHYDGVPFLWIKTPVYKGNGLSRMANMLSYTFKVLLPSYISALDRPDVVIGSSVHPLAALSGLILARRFKVPFLFEVRDLWPQTLIDMGRISRGSLTAGAMRYLEKHLYNRADRIITLMPFASRYIATTGTNTQKIVWLPNGVDLQDWPRPAPKKPGEVFQLLYFGAHGYPNGLDVVIKAFAKARQMPSGNKLRLRLVGDGGLKGELMQMSSDLGLDPWVTFDPPVPKNMIPEISADADAFVFNIIDNPVYNYGISCNKLFDYLAGTRPIIFRSDAPNNPVEDAGAGITVGSDDPELLANAMIEISQTSQQKRKKMGDAGRHYVEDHHDFRSLSAKLADVLNEVMEEHRAKLQ